MSLLFAPYGPQETARPGITVSNSPSINIQGGINGLQVAGIARLFGEERFMVGGRDKNPRCP